MSTTHQGNIPSPLRFVMKVLDKRDEKRCQYSFEMLCKLVLIAISAKPENILAMSQWLDDNQDELFALGFRDKRGNKCLPAQATLYRFFWALEAQIVSLEHHLHGWAAEVLRTTRKRGEVVRIGVDGKQVIGSKRSRRGEKARALLSCYVHEIGLSLKQSTVEGDEAKTALKVVANLQGLEGIPWLFTGDAAFAERPLVETILDKGGMYLFDLKDNLADVKANAQWAFSLPRCEQDSFFEHSEVRSGELWLREIEARPATAELTNDFPAARQFIRCIRTVISKATGEIRKEVEYALTSAYAPAAKLYEWWRGHWQIENCSHHKRDTVWHEDACRTRKAAQAFAALRNLLLSLFHLKGHRQVLRHARRCNAQPRLALELIGLA